MPDLPEPFERSLFRRLADAVENGEAPATLLTDLHATIAEVRAQPPDARDTLALMDLAERVNLPVDELTELLATLEAQPIAARERFLCTFVEGWLMQQREIYDTEQHGGGDSYGSGCQIDGIAWRRRVSSGFHTS